MPIKTLTSPENLQIFYTGLGREGGPLPAFFYFALSGEESLSLHPYNQPVTHLQDAPLRIFSLTLPGHGPGFDRLKAMEYWAEEMQVGNYPIENFIENTLKAIEWLISTEMVDPNHMATGGLSRGGFVATHMAAREKRFRTLLGLAPLTRLKEFVEFQKEQGLQAHAERLNLDHLVEHLTHLHHVRFYIGNRDTRVGTDACYHFIRTLSEKVHEKHARHSHVELMITSSLGHKGHGTAPHIFNEGAEWVKYTLIKG